MSYESVDIKRDFNFRISQALFYELQSVYAISGTSRCLFSDKYKTHKYSRDEAQTALFKTQSVPRCKHFSSRL